MLLHNAEQQVKYDNTLAHIKASISGTVLAVEVLASGLIQTNMIIVNAASNTYIVKQLSGEPGKTGTYLVSKSQNLGLSVLKCLLSSFQEVNLEITEMNEKSSWTRPSDMIISGSINATTLTVTRGLVVIGAILKDNNIKEGTKILSQITGMPGGAGTYNISIAQNLNQQTMNIIVNSRFICNEEGWYNIDYKINMKVTHPDNFHANYVKAASYLSKIINNQAKQISGTSDSIQSTDKNHQNVLSRHTLSYFQVGDQIALQWWAGYYSGAPSVLQTNVNGLSIGTNEYNVPLQGFEDTNVTLRLTKI